MDRLMLLDANGLIYRAYFALHETPLTTSKGLLVNAIFGFWSIVLRGYQDVRPDAVIACFDLPKPTFRHEQFAEYKATRRPMPDDLREQFPRVRELIDAFRMPTYELEGFEADDLIGTLTRQADAQGLHTTIVSGDLDMLQLVSERTSLMTTRGGVQQTVVYDPARIDERYGLRPDQMIDFKALKGDTTDNVPGIPGVGDKTAAKLLQDHGSLDAIYADLASVVPAKLRDKLAEHHDQVMAARDIVTIRRDLPVTLDLGGASPGDYDRSEVIRLFREYEFRTLVERLPPLDGEPPLAPGDLLREADGTQPVPAARVPGRPPARSLAEASGLQLSLDFAALGGSTAAVAEDRSAAVASVTAVDTDPRERLRKVLAAPSAAHSLGPEGGLDAWLSAQEEVTLGIALDDERPRRGTLLGLAVAGRDGHLVVADAADAQVLLGAVMAAGRPLVGHEVKRGLVAELARRDPHGTGVDPGPSLPAIAFDTQIAAYILNAALRAEPLAAIVAERLDLELPTPGALGGPEHAAVEAAATAAVREPLADALAAEGLDRLTAELELPLIPVLAAMEATGVALDRAALGELGETFAGEIARLQDAVYAAVGHEFSLGSPKQLEQVLFYELDLPRGKRTKTGYSTDATVLEELRPAHPLVPLLLDWRTYTKLKSTYVDALPLLIDPGTGRLHTTFHQAVASTGRLSSSDPNLQNIPIRTELGRQIRRAFVAGDPDLLLLSADYSQIELRVLAHVSGDAALRDAFQRHADVHRETAALVLHKEPADVTSDERSMAKMVNFGIAYGMSDFGLSTRANIPRAEAQAFISRYFETYSGIAYYMLAIKDQARNQGYVTTLLGRRRWIPELQQRNPNLRAAGERMAINMPIQGTAADIMKIALIRVAERLAASGSRARLLLQVHDELLVEVPRAELDAVAALVAETMAGAMPLDVPLEVGLKAGPGWDAMAPLPTG